MEQGIGGVLRVVVFFSFGKDLYKRTIFSMKCGKR